MNQIIHAKVGELFEVTLPVTAGTGYRWAVTLPPTSPKAITLIEETHDVPTLRPGAGTVQHFRFQSSTPGKYELAFAYRRGWQAGAAAEERTFEVQIDPAE
jgi:predicted secreted protein